MIGQGVDFDCKCDVWREMFRLCFKINMVVLNRLKGDDSKFRKVDQEFVVFKKINNKGLNQRGGRGKV